MWLIVSAATGIPVITAVVLAILLGKKMVAYDELKSDYSAKSLKLDYVRKEANLLIETWFGRQPDEFDSAWAVHQDIVARIQRFLLACSKPVTLASLPMATVLDILIYDWEEKQRSLPELIDDLPADPWFRHAEHTCHNGWNGLVHRMSQELADKIDPVHLRRVRITCVKERYGSLCVNWFLEESQGETPEEYDEVYDRIAGIIRNYEGLSLGVCELCGCSDSSVRHGSLADGAEATRCKSCLVLSETPPHRQPEVAR